jgi:hypothetical protein
MLNAEFWLSPSQKDGLGSGDIVTRAKVFLCAMVAKRGCSFFEEIALGRPA